MPELDEGRRPRQSRPSDRLRVILHVAAELPLIIFGAAEMAHGWRPLWDNADTALRSYQVFTRQSPLVGHEIALQVGGRPVFGPGPLENWLLAVPVRLDLGQGALWGAVLVAVIAIAVAIEAGWSTARWWGAVVVTASVLLLFAVRADVLVNVVWNAWFGIIFIVPAMASGFAVAAGRLRWWPVTVVAASVVAQSQEVYALPLVLVCLVVPVVGVLARRRRGVHAGRGWLLAGIGVGVLVWLEPVLQEVGGTPGNLTLLWRAARQPGGRVGLGQSLGALGGAISIPPLWVHPPPLHSSLAGFFYSFGILSGPRWWAVLALVVLAGGAAVAIRTGRRLLAAATVVSFTAAVGSLGSIAAIPATQITNVAYLSVLLIPVGTAVLGSLAWIVVEVVRVAVRRYPAEDPSRFVPTSLRTFVLSRKRQLAGLCAGTAIAALFIFSLSSGSELIGISSATVGGWPAIRAADVGAAAVSRIAPHGPFRLRLAEPISDYRFAVMTGVAYQLETQGIQSRLVGGGFLVFGQAGPDLPVVTLVVPATGDDVTARTGD
jgi:hypothetical protein